MSYIVRMGEKVILEGQAEVDDRIVRAIVWDWSPGQFKVALYWHGKRGPQSKHVEFTDREKALNYAKKWIAAKIAKSPNFMDLGQLC